MDDHNGQIDPEFAGLPLKELADAALDQARALGAQHADFRVERIRGQRIALSDGRLQSLSDGDDSGLAVRVVVDGTWGFAAAVDAIGFAANSWKTSPPRWRTRRSMIVFAFTPNSRF